MSINAKPYTDALKLRRREFFPKPNIYAHVDINQNHEAILTDIERLSDRLGSRTEDLILNIDGLQLNKVLTTYTIYYDLGFDTQSTAYLYAKGGVRFEIPINTYNSGVVNGPSPNVLPTVSIYLVAKKSTITFSGDVIVGGIDGTGFPAPLPSSDAIVWGNERIVKEHNGTIVGGLLAGEEIIAKLFSIAYNDISYTGAANPYTPGILYHAPASKDYVDFMQGYQAALGLTKVDSLYESEEALWFKVKNIDTKINTYIPFLNLFDVDVTPNIDDTLLFTEELGINKFRNTPVNNIIRNREHTHTEQVILSSKFSSASNWKYGGGGVVIIVENNNNLQVEIPEDTFISDIIAYHIPALGLFPAYSVPVKSGSIITLDIIIIGNPTTWTGGNIRALSNGAGGLGTQSADGSSMLFKTPTVWILLSAVDLITQKLSYLLSFPASENWIAHDAFTNFRKDNNGFVHLNGYAGVGGAPMGNSGSLYNLPVGYRPSATRIIPGVVCMDTGQAGFTTVTINTNGDVWATYFTGQGTARVVLLTGISFKL